MNSNTNARYLARRRKKLLFKHCLHAAVVCIRNKLLARRSRNPETDSLLQGYQKYNEILNGNINRFLNHTRMNRKNEWNQLVHLLSSEGGLATAGRNSKISPGMKIMIFISTLKCRSSRDKKDDWQLSTSTINLIENEVIESIKRVMHHEVRLEDENVPTHSKLDDDKFRWFRTDEHTCIGALDGTHISACVSESDAPR